MKTPKKLLENTLNILLTISLIILLLLGPLLFFSFNKAFFDNHIKETNFNSISKEKATNLSYNVISFLQSKEDLSEDFTIRETEHMQDVRNLYSLATILFFCSLIVLIICLLTGYYFYKNFFFVFKPLFYSSIISLSLIAVIMIGIILNFDFAFEYFHKVLFPQGNYSFSNKSLLITLFPGEFFESISTIIFSTVIILNSGGLIASNLLRRKYKSTLQQ